MKLLFDENLSPRLPDYLTSLYPGSQHVHTLNLGAADDTAVWNFAQQNGFTIVSKDSDFAERSVLAVSPPKVIWIRLGNCTTPQSKACCAMHTKPFERSSRKTQRPAFSSDADHAP